MLVAPAPRQTHTVKAWHKPAAAAFMVAWFAWFCRDGFTAGFAVDDFMNIGQLWEHGPAWLVPAQFELWRGIYRPMAGVLWMPIYAVFGLNPLPFHIAMLALVLANVWLMYCFARALHCEETVAFFAALIACYHAGLSMLYYNTAFIYDVLCFFFYIAAFVLYARIRAAGRLPRPRETAALLGLYLCALNSKEMAVTLPVALLLDEWFLGSRPAPTWRGVRQWLAGPARTALFAAALTLPYLYGKTVGPGAMTAHLGYRPVIRWSRVLAFQNTQFADIFLRWEAAGWGAIVAVWLALVYLAWRRKSPALRFCCIFVLIAPLPIEFLIGRGNACLYIPLAGWAVFASVLFVNAARAAASFLAGEPLFRRAGRPALAAVLMAAGVVLWGNTNRLRQRRQIRPAIAAAGGIDPDVLNQLRALTPRVPPGSQVVFLNDPFDGWDMAFLAELQYHERSVTVRLQRKTPLSAEEIARAQYVFDYREGKLVRLRP